MTPVRHVLPDGEDLIINQARPADATDIVLFANQTGGESDFLAFGAGEFGASVVEETVYLERLAREQGSFVLKGTVAGAVVAVCSVVRRRRMRLQHGAELGVAVRAVRWGQGIGRRLCETALVEARARGLRKINLRLREDNERALRLYRSLGFVQEGLVSRAIQIEGVFFAERLMGLPLDEGI